MKSVLYHSTPPGSEVHGVIEIIRNTSKITFFWKKNKPLSMPREIVEKLRISARLHRQSGDRILRDAEYNAL